ncbi:MAG: hypothetical protein JW954_04870 [Dehalococcoidaceae bacterium]|nr:hypothetical protein [Dehalococcoidaceae bacterium]
MYCCDIELMVADEGFWVEGVVVAGFDGWLVVNWGVVEGIGSSAPPPQDITVKLERTNIIARAA